MSNHGCVAVVGVKVMFVVAFVFGLGLTVLVHSRNAIADITAEINESSKQDWAKCVKSMQSEFESFTTDLNEGHMFALLGKLVKRSTGSH
eukprot:12344758-Karenia_brevis.AAC.1